MESAIIRIFDTGAVEDGGFGDEKNRFSCERPLTLKLETFAGTATVATVVIAGMDEDGEVLSFEVTDTKPGQFVFEKVRPVFHDNKLHVL